MFIKPWLLIATLSACLSGCSGEPDLASIAADDPIRPVLHEWGKKTVNRYAVSNHTKPSFLRPWTELHSKALTELFPDHRFLCISWDEKPVWKWVGDQRVSRALQLSITLAYKRDTGAWSEIPGSGNYEPYGRLLAQQKVELKTDAQAKLIWEGFCDLHQKHWRDQGIEQRSDRLWHLGVITIEGIRYYYQVDVDESGKVLSARLHSEASIR